MGLDTYASRSTDDIILSDEDLEAFSKAEITLCGGILSGNDGSFRGKIYEIMILDITNQSLHQDWISPETVLEMHTALEKCDPQQAFQEYSWHRCSPLDILECRKSFKVCSDRGLGLINWG